MFVTGPDVIKTVTHEEVTKEDLGGAMTHNVKSGVAHFAVDDDRACLALIRELLSYLPSNNLEEPPLRADRRSRRPRGPGPRHPDPRRAEQALRHQAAHRGAWWTTGASSRCTQHFAPNIVVGFARFGGPQRGHRGQPARGARRLPRHRRLGEGRALRALLRRLQHPARHLRGRARLPARHRPGVRRHHPPRRQAALRLRRGHRAQDHRHHPQGLRRRLLRDGQQAHPHRPQLRLSRPRRSRSWGRRAR